MKYFKMVEDEVSCWRARDGGLTRAAVDAIADANSIQRAFEAKDLKTLEWWMNDDRRVISEAASDALLSVRGFLKALKGNTP